MLKHFVDINHKQICIRVVRNRFWRELCIPFSLVKALFVSTGVNIWAQRAFCRESLLFQCASNSFSLHANWFPVAISRSLFFSPLFCLIFSAFDIPSFWSYNGVMSTSQTEDIVAGNFEDRYWWSFDWASERVECLHVVGIDRRQRRRTIPDGLIDSTISYYCFLCSEFSLRESFTTRVRPRTAIRDVIKRWILIDSGQYVKDRMKFV